MLRACKGSAKSKSKSEVWKMIRATDHMSAEEFAEPSISEFRRKVFNVLCEIPKGKVTSYGAIAKVLKTSPRAVGNALRHNPFAPVVPCHRVIASNLELGGFQGQKGPGAPSIAKKIKLLENEGVTIEENKVCEKHMLHTLQILDS